MSYTVTFWAFAKKPNSTKQPTATGDTFTCDLMDNSGIVTPTIKLHTAFTDPSNYTYAYLTSFSRYYFISNWRYDRGLWWADLTVDVLASFKTEIGSQTMYVLRSASQSDGRILDTKYPAKVGSSFTVEQNNLNPFAVSFSSGYFIVGIINNDSAAIGMVSYYVFTNQQFRDFAAYILGDVSYLQSPAEVSDELLKCLVNPTQYIVSCTWVPFIPPQGAAVQNISIGWWTINNMPVTRLSGYTRAGGSVTISVPKHPDAATRGAYLNQEPYASYYLDFPPFGSISLPANALIDTSLLDLQWDVDCITGAGRLDIRGGPTGHIGTITIVQGQVGVPVMLAQNAPNLGGATQSVVSGWGDKAAGWVQTGVDWIKSKIPEGEFTEQLSGWPGKIRASAANHTNIVSAAAATLMPLQTVGGNGGYMAGYYPIRMIGTFATLVPENNSEWGRPLCQSKQLNTLSGYILCAETDFEISCTSGEKNQIGEFLTGGFFYE